MIVFCHLHGQRNRVLCRVERNPVGGLVQVKYRDPRMRAHHMEAARLEGRDNGFQNIGLDPGGSVEVRGCPECGVRSLPNAALINAFERGEAKISA